MSGWIKLHRKITEHWIWEDPEKLKWWLDLIMMANHQARDILINNEIMTINIGERHTSEQKLANRWGCSRKKVSNFLKLLEQDGMIKVTKSRQKGTTYKVLNYADYQGKKEDEAHQKNIEGTSKEHQEHIKGTTEAHKQELKELEELKELKEVAVVEQDEKIKTSENNSGDLPLSKNVFKAWEELWMFPNHVQQQILIELTNFYSDELVVAAIKIAGSKDVIKGRAINFIEAVLKEWEDNNVKDIEQARAYQRNRNNQKRNRGFNQNNNNATVKGPMPDWAMESNDDVEDEEITEESQQAYAERLERLRKMREGAKS